MARIRSIKPEFWRSPSTAAASPWARLLYIAMWNWADDYGVGEWTPRELLGFAFPNDANITDAEFQSLCTEVATCFNTAFYLAAGRRYYCIPEWDKHQKNERRASGKYPRPDGPDSSPDPVFSSPTSPAAERRGNSARPHGKDPAGTGEQGNRGTGNREQISSAPSVLDLLFESAWRHWPKKVERKKAFEQFKVACRSNYPEELANDIAEFGDAYAATTERQFVPALGVWLRGERWTDEMPQPRATEKKQTAADRALSISEQLRREEHVRIADQRSIG